MMKEAGRSPEICYVPGVKHSYQNLCEHPAIAEKHIRFYADLLGRNYTRGSPLTALLTAATLQP